MIIRPKDKKFLYTTFGVIAVFFCVWILFKSGSGLGDPEKAAEKQGKQLLRVWWEGGDDSRAVTVLQKVNRILDRKFFSRHTNIIRLSSTRLVIPDAAKDGSMLMALAGGTAPDAMLYWIAQAQTLIDQGFLESLEPYIDEEKKKDPDFEKRIFIPDRVKPAITKYNPETGRVERYGLIVRNAYKALVYHRNLFLEAGLDPDRPPKNWEELMEYGIKLSRPEKVIEQARARQGQLGLAEVGTGVQNFFIYNFWMAGGDLVRQFKYCPHHKETVSLTKEESFQKCPVCHKDLTEVPVQWKVTWNSEAGVKTLEFLKKLRWTPWIREKNKMGQEKEYKFSFEQFENREKVHAKDGRIFDLNDDSTRNRINFGCVYIRPGNIKDIEVIRMFANSEIAMIMVHIDEDNLIKLDKEGVQFDEIQIAPIPVGPAGVPTTHMMARLMGINSQSSEKAKRAAWEYIKFRTGEEARRIRVKTFLENGMYYIVQPRFLKEFGYDEFYKRFNQGMRNLYASFDKYGRSMPWNEGWMPIWSSVLPQVVEPIMKVEGGYKADPKQLLKSLQDVANKSMLKVKDEKKYRKSRIRSYPVFIVIVAGFIWALIYIIRTRVKNKKNKNRLELLSILTSGTVLRRTLSAWLFLMPAILSVVLWRYYPLGPMALTLIIKTTLIFAKNQKLFRYSD